MPFVTVMGIPEETPLTTLHYLRRRLVEAVADEASCRKDWVRVFFPEDRLANPVEEAGGADTIYVRVDTGLFASLPVEFRQKPLLDITNALTTIIWQVFDGTVEVEAFVGEIDQSTKSLVSALRPKRLPQNAES